MGVAQSGSEVAPNAAETTVENDGNGNAKARITGNRLVAWSREKGGARSWLKTLESNKGRDDVGTGAGEEGRNGRE